jgi:hypothetical protein
MRVSASAPDKRSYRPCEIFKFPITRPIGSGHRGGRSRNLTVVTPLESAKGEDTAKHCYSYQRQYTRKQFPQRNPNIAS